MVPYGGCFGRFRQLWQSCQNYDKAVLQLTMSEPDDSEDAAGRSLVRAIVWHPQKLKVLGRGSYLGLGMSDSLAQDRSMAYCHVHHLRGVVR